MLVATSPHVDVVLEVTGAVEDAIAPVLAGIEHGKHMLLMNPELDGTLGPLLKAKADRQGVVFTDVDGDQPGVIGNLHRFVKGIGLRPVLLGNIKGLQDPYRNPTTQEGFAQQWGQKPHMVTSFADGTKVSFEMTVAANATGMTVAKRGMHGYSFPAGTPITEAAKSYDAEEILAGPGIVDYVVGCAPGPGVWALGTHREPAPAPLPQPLQARRGAALLLPHPLPPLPFRGADHHRPRRAAQRRRDHPARRAHVETITMAKTPLDRRHRDRHARRLHRLRRGGEGGDHRGARTCCPSASPPAAG